MVLPAKSDLDLGPRLALCFAVGQLPAEAVAAMFRRKGAYVSFKALLEARNAFEQWYEYERQTRERAIREWCSSEGLELAD